MTNVFNALKKRDQHAFDHQSLLGLSQWLVTVLFVVLLMPSFGKASDSEKPSEKETSVEELMIEVKNAVRKRGYKWDLSVFNADGYKTKGLSVDKKPLIYFTCGDKDSSNKALVLSSVHGDEVNPLYFGFRIVEWLKARPELCAKSFVVIAPLVNPDGILRFSKGTRTNFNKIDVNRNFDTPDFDKLAMKLWKEKYRSRRYYPGTRGGSEPETVFQKWLIDEYKPAKILSIHAPLNMMDYDGPASEGTDAFSKTYVESCEKLKKEVQKATPSLRLYSYGIYPGSLGNYAGKQRGIPTFTLELPTTDPSLAGQYFGELEEGTRLFISQHVEQKQARNDD